jgi:hypothetical protein
MSPHNQLAFTRRTAIAGAAAGLVVALPQAALGHVANEATAATPATAVEGSLDPAEVLRVSQALVGGGTLAEEAVPGLATMLAHEPDIAASLKAIASLSEVTTASIATLPEAAQRVAANIVSYWYIGEYDGKPAPNRADIFFSFASWQTLPYMTQPTLCKAFGYWATDVMPG